MIYLAIAAALLVAFAFYVERAKDQAIDKLLKDQAVERGGWNLERTNLIHAEAAAQMSWDAERNELITANDDERKAWATERRDLNNRIQVPQAAPFMDPGREQKPQHVPFDDDEMFAENQREALEQWP